MNKWTAVVDYLIAAFRGARVEALANTEDRRALASTFLIDGASSGHRLEVSHEFFDDNGEDDIIRLLGEWEIARRLREAGNRTVLVDNRGPYLLEE